MLSRGHRKCLPSSINLWPRLEYWKKMTTAKTRDILTTAQNQVSEKNSALSKVGKTSSQHTFDVLPIFFSKTIQ